MRRFILAAVAALALGAGSARAERLVIAQATDSLIYLASYVGHNKGYFREEGLESELRIFRGGVQALAAVIAGDADIYLGPASTAMKARRAGQNVVVFGSIMTQIPTNIVIRGDVAQARGITAATPMEERIRALRGLTIGVNAVGSAPDQVLQYTLRNVGLDPQRDVRISPVGSSAALLGNFEQRRIDGFAFSSPASDIAVERFGGLMVVNYGRGEFAPLRGFLYLGLIARAEWLAENPDRAARALRGFQRALQLIQNQPDEARAALRMSFRNMDEASLAQGFAANAAAVPATVRVDPHSVELNRTFSETVEGISLDPDISQVFTNRYVDLATQR